MKKVSLIAALVATVAGTSASADLLMGGCPKAFQGFHLGGNIGYGVGKVHHKYKNNITGARHTTDFGVNGVDGGIGTGYTYRLCNWALGIAFDANWANSEGKRKEIEENDHFKVRLRNSLQLYGRAGYVIGGMAMPFVKLGWDNSRWKTAFRSGSSDHHHSKRFNGFLWGIGADFLATKHVVVGFEYTGVQSQRKRFSSDSSVRTSIRPQYNKFAATLKVVY